MTLNDVGLLGKKILVGIIITVVPFVIIFGGLWLTRKLLDKPAANPEIVKPIKTTGT